MPKPSLDQLKQKQDRLKTKLAGKGESLEAPARRKLKKRIRRTQRRVRRIEADAARRAKKAGAKDEAAAG